MVGGEHVLPRLDGSNKGTRERMNAFIWSMAHAMHVAFIEDRRPGSFRQLQNRRVAEAMHEGIRLVEHGHQPGFRALRVKLFDSRLARLERCQMPGEDLTKILSGLTRHER